MAEPPPSSPGLGWQEDGGPRNRSPPVPHGVSMQAAPHWLPVYPLVRKNMDCIEAFSTSGVKGLRLKVEFLASICRLLKAARLHGLQPGLAAFCRSHRLAQSIRMLLEQEPAGQLRTAVRHRAMDAIAELSSVEAALAGQEQGLLDACCRSVFFLPAERELMRSCPLLYTRTLRSMDTMLLSVVLCFQTSRLSEELQTVLQMLLGFTHSDSDDARERAMGRILTLTYHLSKTITLEDWHHHGKSTYGPICYGDLPIPILGQLLGRALVLRSSDAVMGCQALDTLLCLYEFVQSQTSRARMEDGAKLSCSPESASLLHAPTTKDFLLLFANHLHPPERRDLVHVAIKGLRGADACENRGARDVLDVVMRDPRFWLADVPRIMRCIQENLEAITMEPARQSLRSLLAVLSAQRPALVAVSLVKFSAPQDSAGAAMWDLMLSLPRALEGIFMELLLKPQHAEDFSILGDPVASSGMQAKQDGTRAERRRSLATVSLLLSTLIVLSETPAMARKMKALVPRIALLIPCGDEDVRGKALGVLGTVLSQQRPRDASAIAAGLPRALLPLLHEERPQVRERCIRLFRSLLGSALGSDRQRMRSGARLFLLPLFLCRSHPADGVAEASGEALAAAAELLRWKRLHPLLEPWQPCRVAELLALRSRSGAEERLRQSLGYLEDAEAPVRAAAVRFIGVAARPFRGTNPVLLRRICGALEATLGDSDPAVRSLAHQNLLILRSPRGGQRSGWSPRPLRWRWC